jgi:hypothetical protein
LHNELNLYLILQRNGSSTFFRGGQRARVQDGGDVEDDQGLGGAVALRRRAVEEELLYGAAL